MCIRDRHYASRDSGNVDVVRFFVTELDCDPNTPGHFDKTPLQYAVENRHLQLIQYLFTKGLIDLTIRLNTLNNIYEEDLAVYYAQPRLDKHLHSAAYRGDLNGVMCLLEEHNHYDLQRLHNRKTALHCAAEGGHLHVLKYFIEERACSILLFDKNIATPLHLAAGKGHLDIVKYLTLEKKCDPTIKDINGDTPLHYTARGSGSIDVIKFILFQLKCNPSSSGHFGKTILHYAAKFRHFELISFLVISVKVDPMHWDMGGSSPLHRACQYGDTDVVACLVEDMVTDDVCMDRNVIRFTPLHTACLLYTSPSPRDATLSRMPSSA